MGRPRPRPDLPLLHDPPWVAATSDGGVPVFFDNLDVRLLLARAVSMALVVVSVVFMTVPGRPLTDEPALRQPTVPAPLESPIHDWDEPASGSVAADAGKPEIQYAVPPAVQPVAEASPPADPPQPAQAPVQTEAASRSAPVAGEERAATPPPAPRQNTPPASRSATIPLTAPVISVVEPLVEPVVEPVVDTVVGVADPVVEPVTSLVQPVTGLVGLGR